MTQCENGGHWFTMTAIGEGENGGTVYGIAPGSTCQCGGKTVGVCRVDPSRPCDSESLCELVGCRDLRRKLTLRADNHLEQK